MRTAKAQTSLHNLAVWSWPSLSAYRIVGYHRMCDWRSKARMILYSCAGLSASMHFAHIRRYFFFGWTEPMWLIRNVTKTYLYYFDPIKPHFYIVKLGFTGVFIIFLISLLLKNIDCWYSLELPRWGGSNENPQSMIWAEIWKKIRVFFIWIFSVFGGKFFYIFE